MLVIAYYIQKEPYSEVDEELYRSKLKRLQRLANNGLHK